MPVQARRTLSTVVVTAIALLLTASEADGRTAQLTAAACASEVEQSYHVEASPNQTFPLLDATQVWATAWQSRSSSNVGLAGAPFVQDGQVYIDGPDNVLHVLAVGTGRERWSLGDGDGLRLFSFRQTAEGVVALIGGAGNATLVSFDAGGHRLWERLFQGRSQPMPSTLSTAGDQVYVIVGGIEGTSPLNSEPARLQAIGVTDGIDRWARPLALQPELYTAAPAFTYSTPVGNSVVVHQTFVDPTPKLPKTPKTVVLALDRSTGDKRWSLPPFDGLEQPVGVLDGALLSAQEYPKALIRRDVASGVEVGRYQDCLLNAGLFGYAVDGTRVYWMPGTEVLAADLKTQERLWTLPLGRSGSPQSVLPVVSSGHLYLGGSDGGYIYSLDPKTGRVEGRFKAQETGRYGSAPIRVGNLLLVQYEQLTAYRLPAT